MFSFLVLSFLSFCACDASVNRSQYVRDGESSAGLTSVNGSIRVGANCTVAGNCRTVNGRIDIGDNSRVEELDTVNGRIVIGANVDVNGDAGTVNGAVECGTGSKVRGRVSTINGRVELRNTTVNDEVSTVNGDVLLSEKSVVRGSIVIKGRHGHFSGHDRLEIRVAGGSIVEGGIDVRDPERKVKVYIDKESRVNGEIRNAEVVRE
jgi:predicted acyltransferase (DUF342 family)